MHRSALASFVTAHKHKSAPAATAYDPEILRENWREAYCPMFARKWVAETAAPLQKALVEDLGLIPQASLPT